MNKTRRRLWQTPIVLAVSLPVHAQLSPRELPTAPPPPEDLRFIENTGSEAPDD